MRRLLVTVMLLAGMALDGPAFAGQAQDRLFAAGVLDPVPTGQRLVFGHTRSGTFDGAILPQIPDGEMAVTIAESESGSGGREARVTARDADTERPLVTLPVTAGHPLLLIFLETTVRDIAALTGGSPYYIRNRIREALAAQDAMEPATVAVESGSVAGEMLMFRPFTDDANRDKLGELADLEIRVTLSDSVPGEVARLEALAGPAFSETIVFERLEGG